MGAYEGYKQHGCFWANLGVERSWLAQVGHLSPPLHEWVWKAVFWAGGAFSWRVQVVID